MRKNLITASLTAMLLMGAAGHALAQSDAMEKAYDANEEPLTEGSGVTKSNGEQSDTATGHSQAADESMDAVKSETDETTDVPDSDQLDEINAEGQSDAAGEAIESQ
ncbi:MULTISPECIES: hypothetical protein [Salinicola]|uniref:Uncharacterized protein n=1 Tax=Salinicola socius TaxID=404433 RepID=A0A1Q8SV43_9GAMM|nr:MULTISPECIES: hypothetical protein [Salinicola]OLO05314.1 hypothetical protein BTW07_04600 [Salinicola socius]